MLGKGKVRFRFTEVTKAIICAASLIFIFNYVSRVAGNESAYFEVYKVYLPNMILGTCMTILVSFFMLNELYVSIAEKRKAIRFLPSTLICVGLIIVYNLLVDYWMPLPDEYATRISFSKQILVNFLVAVIYLVFVYVISYIYHLRDVKKRSRQLEAQKLKLEVEKAQAELKFLRTQINPHFLHNTLNSFYARSLPFSPELADGILTLSSMMRYALSESSAPNGKVYLRDEIEHLQNFIKINQFRFRNNLNVTLEIMGIVNGHAIIPFVLITLVENIFNHGDFSNPSHPTIIRISVDEGGLRYVAENRKKTGPKELSTGIGLDNIKKRLQVEYGNDFALSITESSELYKTELIICNL